MCIVHWSHWKLHTFVNTITASVWVTYYMLISKISERKHQECIWVNDVTCRVSAIISCRVSSLEHHALVKTKKAQMSVPERHDFRGKLAADLLKKALISVYPAFCSFTVAGRESHPRRPPFSFQCLATEISNMGDGRAWVSAVEITFQGWQSPILPVGVVLRSSNSSWWK